MMRISFLLVFMPLICLGQDGAQKIDSLLVAVEQFHTAKYELTALELINEEWVENKSTVSYRKNPFAIYIKYQKPHEGLEVLLKEGDKKALINPNGFPFINMYLDPYGYLMREDQHHTVYESGLSYFASVLKQTKEKIKKEGLEGKCITFLGVDTVEGKNYYHIQIENPLFKQEKYQVKKGEDLVSIAREKGLNEHYILEQNELYFYESVDEGQEISISNSFAQKVEVWLDTKTYLPLIQKIYMNNALYEQYEFKKVQLNISIPSEEFTAEYEGYGF